MTVPINGALRVRGVALVVRNPRGEILLVEEGETKPEFGKYAGMFSPPMETLLYRKEPLLTAVGRLIAEEIPGFSGHITVEEKWRGVYCLDAGPIAALFVGETARTDLPSPSQSGGEVNGHRWVHPREALEKWLRAGAWEMIVDYLEDREGVIRRRCFPPMPLHALL